MTCRLAKQRSANSALAKPHYRLHVRYLHPYDIRQWAMSVPTRSGGRIWTQWYWQPHWAIQAAHNWLL